MKIVAIVQARMGSSRLPGKVLMEVNGKPIIWYIWERLGRVRGIDEIIVATSDDPANDPLADYVRGLGGAVFRGSEQDVLDRFYQAARVSSAGGIVRVTGDCPLLETDVIEKAVSLFRDTGADYVSNTMERTYPDGLDVEVVRFEALERAWKEARLPSQREHVTPFICVGAGFSRVNFKQERDDSKERWVVDQAEDFELIRFILEQLYPANPFFTREDVLELKERYPEKFQVNGMISLNEGYTKSLEKDKDFL